MNYKLTTLALAFSGLLLTACGSSSSSSSTENGSSNTVETEPSSTTSVASITNDELSGTWIESGGCKVIDDKSEYSLFTINSIDAILSEKKYSNTSCNETGLISHADSTFALITGSETKGNDRVSAIEIDLTRTKVIIHTGAVTIPPKDVTFYTMYRIDEQGRLIISEGTELRNGATVEERANDFSKSTPYLRQ